MKPRGEACHRPAAAPRIDHPGSRGDLRNAAAQPRSQSARFLEQESRVEGQISGPGGRSVPSSRAAMPTGGHTRAPRPPAEGSGAC